MDMPVHPSSTPAASQLDPAAMDLACIDLSSPFTRSFHRFNSLPQEIRLLIWHLAMPRPAVIERVMNYTLMEHDLLRHAPDPAVLLVSWEPRTELLRDTERRRGGIQEPFELVRLTDTSGKKAYVNCEKDTLYIYRAPPRAIMPDAANFTNIQLLAMDWGLRPCWVQEQCHVGVQFIQRFPSLKTFTLLVTFLVPDLVLTADDDPNIKYKKQTRIQRRRALGEIKSGVMDAIRDAEETSPGWKAPELRVVPKTRYWTGGSALPSST
ncbi:hypothetical protein CGCVW01_v004960 [Colletotrichum viniferum]|nr:hypothetical protein CGCVW01_v004960 [Colletotrichum viniferum]